MLENLVFMAQQRFGFLVAAPVPVVHPLVVVEPNQSAHERGQRSVSRRRRGDLVVAVADAALVTFFPALIDEGLESAMLGADDAERENFWFIRRRELDGSLRAGGLSRLSLDRFLRTFGHSLL